MYSRMEPITAFFARFFDGQIMNFTNSSQTQSQELGAETVFDNEMLIDLGMVCILTSTSTKYFDLQVLT